MISESFAIIAILLLVLLVGFKSKNNYLIFFILPYLVVPLSYLIALPISSLFAPALVSRVVIVTVIIGGILGCLFNIFLPKIFENQHLFKTFAVYGCIFNVGLTIGYIVNLI